MTTAAAGSPLAGTTVIDLSRALAGPHAAQVMGDLGARVIKVESAGGDDTRGYGPPFVGPEDDPISTYYLSCNRNKESIVLDLKSDDGRETLERLVGVGDVLIENFRPGVLDRLGFTVARLHQLNPRLVILKISGFGEDGPEGGRAGYDQIAQGEAGLMSLTGPGPDDPQRVGVPIGDLLGGLHGVIGVLAALEERHRTGVGRVVRTSLLASVVGVHAFQGTAWTVAGQVPRAQGNHHPSISPYGLFTARDGQLQIACGSEGLWVKFAEAFGIDPGAEGMATNADRVRNPELVRATINGVFAGHDVADLLGVLATVGVPAGEVRTLDRVYDWEQTRSQHLVLSVDHPVLGPIELPGSPLRFDDNDFGSGRATHLPPPGLGEHSDAVRAWLDEVAPR
ncbi:MAG: CoA transferase [Nocardioides sp.]